MDLSESDIQRYSRQLVLKGWGGRQQVRLSELRAAVSSELPSAARYLAAAGVGTILLYGEGADERAAELRALNSALTITALHSGASVDWAVLKKEHSDELRLQAARSIAIDLEEKCLILADSDSKTPARLVKLAAAGGSQLPADLAAGCAAACLLLDTPSR